ncbi:hypothetical protein HNO92_002380 [Chromobacterium alkanivorans]|uniref:hypothetical protein n=1 Tax=Chromobacterium alkanivorans TaxID=1071719 RepID=UPI002167292D|nr:hypothetical protein [Chromobacterium alkanivorans]MCS3804883.1 hypothetical protein [Chromobacterium alkanivorans]MCS3819554.1 hypothetical protein [Chromobacterium alkanivorans]MCS3874066.1 hypothetical protein [Chromobacterium alkanivorans]
MLIDAELATLLPPLQPSDGVPGQPRRCRHHGKPAEALAMLLGGVQRRRPAWRNRARVLLGYPWAHSQLLPWQDGLSGQRAQWRAYAQGLLRERGVGGELDIRLAPAAYGAARLAFAAHAPLLADLRAAARAAGWRLAGCRDLLSSCLQAHPRASASGGLVLAEAGAVTCLWRGERGWEELLTLALAPGQSAAEGVAAAEALCGREPGGDYGWSATQGPTQQPLAARARWLGFPHPLLASQPCAA